MISTRPLDGWLPLTGPAAAHWGLIRASGADAASFLHGQLTNDFSRLDASGVRLAGYCSAKGRLLASFIAWRDGDDFILACHPSVHAATLKRLSMFVLRARCRLTDASADMAVCGAVGATAASLLGDCPVWARRPVADDAHLIRLPDADGVSRALWVSPSGASPPDAPAISSTAWRWLEVLSGVATIEAATADRFVPQMLNFELIGGVDFQKGCYPGQEVVARSQYRGTIKRRTHLFEIAAGESGVLGDSGDAAAKLAGVDVFHAADPAQPAGTVANAAADPASGRVAALVEVKTALLAGGSLHLGHPAGPLLSRTQLPYALPADAEPVR